jgi:lysophospholipase L1-like esterase
MQKKAKILIIVGAVLTAAAIAFSIFFFGFYLPDRREEKEREELIRAYYAAKKEMYAEENERYADYEVDVAFLGDSLTDGYDLATYYPQYLTANRGIGGETSHGLEERLEVSLYDLKPKVAVILIGGNNLGTMLENYERMISAIKEKLPETKIILASLTSMGGSWGHKNQIAAYNNVVIEKLAEKYGFTFVDLYYPLFDLSTGEIRAEYTVDGAHLTPLGYEVVTAAITPAIESLLGK